MTTMASRILWFTCAMLVAAATLFPARASAFCQTTTCKPGEDDCEEDEDGCPLGGVAVHFTELPIVYRFHARGSRQLVRDEARSAIREAFHRWSDAICDDGRRTSLRFREGDDLDEDKPLKPGARGSEPFGIYFRDFGWPHDTPDATLALTTHFFGMATGRIEYSDMEINTATKRFSTLEAAGEGIDLQAVVTHEVGHYIGLAHSREPLSIMAASYCETDDRCEKGRVAARRLGPDDIDAVCTVYPPGGQPAAAPESASQGCATSDARPLEMPGAALFASVAAVVAWVRRRRRG